MATIHISETDAVRDIVGLLARVHGGEEIVIQKDAESGVLMRKVQPTRRSVSESISLAKARTAELGYKPVMDAGFAVDLEEVIRNRKPRKTSAWD